MTSRRSNESSIPSAPARPRLGFLGIGWIGLHRLRAICGSGLAQVVAVADPSEPARLAAREIARNAEVLEGMDELLDRSLDAVVIATPSALHAEQCLAALARGLAVFCQKPLGRTAGEVLAVLSRAREADRLLGVDMSYRFVRAAQATRDILREGHLGSVYAADLVFHNAYGPDKPWFYDTSLSGGGCVIDLGIHLVDLALWVLDFPPVERVESRLFAGGEPLRSAARAEDHALAWMDLEGGATVSLACSWGRSLGRDAVIEFSFHSTGGGLALRNVGGSFYDFRLERLRGTSCHVIDEPPDDWGGRAALAWLTRLCRSTSYDPSIEESLEVARILDAIYEKGTSSPRDVPQPVLTATATQNPGGPRPSRRR